MSRVLAALTVVGLLALAPESRPARAQTPGQPSDPAIAALVASVSTARLRAIDARLVAFGTRSTFSEKSGSKTRGVFAARDWIAGQFRDIARTSGGRMTVALDSYLQEVRPRIPRAVEISSPVASLRGDEPGSRTYVISSHYDSRNSDNDDGVGDAPGADDNASATACVLEAARIMAPMQFRGTIVFATYDAEEQGLLGSGHHAATLKAAGVDVQGDLNNDIIGASTDFQGHSGPNEVRLFSESLPVGAVPNTVNHVGSENDSPSRELARFAKDAGLRYVPEMSIKFIYRTDRFLRGGDQESYLAQGFPAVRFVEPYENFDHQHQNTRVENGTQYGDLMQFMDFDYLTRVCRINVATLASLALGPGVVRNLKMLTQTLSNDTVLTWAATPGAISYEVVSRETSEPLWGPPLVTVGVTTATLRGYSKDNALFGVRAVDAQGHRGVVAFPTPER